MTLQATFNVKEIVNGSVDHDSNDTKIIIKETEEKDHFILVNGYYELVITPKIAQEIRDVLSYFIDRMPEENRYNEK